MYQQQTVVLVPAPLHPQGYDEAPPDYTIPKARIPSILLLIAGILNAAALLVLGILDGFDNGVIEFGISGLVFTSLGILAIVVSFRKQKTSKCVIAVVVLSSLALVYVCVEIILQTIAMLVGGLVGYHAKNEDDRLFGMLLLIVSGVLLFISVFVFILCIVLISLSSQKVCCRVPAASQGVIYHATPTASTYAS